VASDSALCAPQFVRAEEAADGVADSVFLTGPQVAVDVEGDLGGLVAQRRLYVLHVATRVDQCAGEEVAQVVERDRLGQPGASTMLPWWNVEAGSLGTAARLCATTAPAELRGCGGSSADQADSGRCNSTSSAGAPCS
jgi:hypothetical protein